MISEEKTDEILKQLCDAVVKMDAKTDRELNRIAIEKGIDAYYAVNKGPFYVKKPECPMLFTGMNGQPAINMAGKYGLGGVG